MPYGTTFCPGSLQAVKPGRMRNQLKPQGLAEYVVRGVGPALLSRPELVGPSHWRLYLNGSSPVSMTQNIDYTTLSEYEGKKPQIPAIDLEALRQKLAALPPLVFRRRARAQVTGLAADPKMMPIFGSVTANDVAKHISDEHAMALVPPDAIVTLLGPGRTPITKIKSLGSWDATVRLKTGETVPLIVQIDKQSSAT